MSIWLDSFVQVIRLHFLFPFANRTCNVFKTSVCDDVTVTIKLEAVGKSTTYFTRKIDKDDKNLKMEPDQYNSTNLQIRIFVSRNNTLGCVIVLVSNDDATIKKVCTNIHNNILLFIKVRQVKSYFTCFKLRLVLIFLADFNRY